ncbi:eCIS core domain-containing protein [Myxococcus fulvus]|uniref:eCIS core domain-containing protein n=1 Tax=Myxococcus fulvus TaxID=33 RepID=UPI003B9C899A
MAPKPQATPMSTQAKASPIIDEFIPSLPIPGKDLLKKVQDAANQLEGQPLDDAQKKDLKKVFGDSVDVDKVSVVKGPSTLFDNLSRYTPAFTVGNKILVNPKAQDGSPTNFPPSKDLLTHEATHVWQYQNHGADYAAKALVAQGAGQGYDWEKGLDSGKKWADLNPEQQGELIQDAYKQGYFDGKRPFVGESGKDRTAYLDEAVKQMRAGKGDPNWDFSKATGKWNEVKDAVVDGVKDAGKKVWDTVTEPLERVKDGILDRIPWL